MRCWKEHQRFAAPAVRLYVFCLLGTTVARPTWANDEDELPGPGSYLDKVAREIEAAGGAELFEETDEGTSKWPRVYVFKRADAPPGAILIPKILTGKVRTFVQRIDPGLLDAAVLETLDETGFSLRALCAEIGITDKRLRTLRQHGNVGPISQRIVDALLHPILNRNGRVFNAITTEMVERVSRQKAYYISNYRSLFTGGTAKIVGNRPTPMVRLVGLDGELPLDKALVALRKARNLTVAELAAELGTGHATLWRYEARLSLPQPKVFKSLLEKYGDMEPGALSAKLAEYKEWHRLQWLKPEKMGRQAARILGREP